MQATRARGKHALFDAGNRRENTICSLFSRLRKFVTKDETRVRKTVLGDARRTRGRRRARIEGVEVNEDRLENVQDWHASKEKAARSSNTVHCDDVVGHPNAEGEGSVLNHWCRQATSRAWGQEASEGTSFMRKNKIGRAHV